MKRALIGCSALAGVLMIAIALSPVFATCPAQLNLTHQLGGWFSNCPEPVRAFAYAVGTGAAGDTCTASTCNTAAVSFVCTDATQVTGQGGPCQTDSGTPTDGNVTISFDWGGGGTFPGCPNPNHQPNIGRNFVQVVAANGASLFVTVPYSFDLDVYAVDMAQPDTFPAGTISCEFATQGGLKITSYSGGTLCGTLPVPTPHTDCDAGTWGATGGGVFSPTCSSSTILPLTRGKVYRHDGPCAQAPDPVLATGGWTNIAVDPVANPNFASQGTFCIPVPAPAAGQCAYIGGTTNVGGTETLALTGNLQLPGPTAPSARALDVRARTVGANVVVSFRTEGELGLIGFNALSDSQGGKTRIKVNTALIAPKGAQGGGATYEISLPKGNFKGGKNVYIESVTSTGSLLSDPASF